MNAGLRRPTVKEQVRAKFLEGVNDCNTYIADTLDGKYRELVDKFNEEGGMQARRVNFARMYVDLANEVWRLHKRIYLPEAFNAFWNSRLAEDARIQMRFTVRVKCIDEAYCGKRAIKGLNYEVSNWLGRYEEVKYDDLGDGWIFFQPMACADEDYIQKVLTKFFKDTVLKRYLEEMESELDEFAFVEFDPESFVLFYQLDELEKNNKLSAIRFFGNLSMEEVIKKFSKMAEVEGLNLEFHHEKGFALGEGENLFDRL